MKKIGILMTLGLILTVVFAGCTQSEQGTATGAVLGGATGAIIGHQTGHRAEMFSYDIQNITSMVRQFSNRRLFPFRANTYDLTILNPAVHVFEAVSTDKYQFKKSI